MRNRSTFLLCVCPFIRRIVDCIFFIITQQGIGHRIAPAAHGFKHWSQFCAQWGEGIEHAWRGFGKGGAGDEAVAFETLEPMCEGVGADAGQRCTQLREALWAVE